MNHQQLALVLMEIGKDNPDVEVVTTEGEFQGTVITDSARSYDILRLRVDETLTWYIDCAQIVAIRHLGDSE